MSSMPPQQLAARTKPATSMTVADLVGVSAWAQTMRRDVLHAANADAVVMVSGPTGTGKELIANALHSHSRRAGHPFIPVDCTCVIGDLFASHMFGHTRGAFTGAHSQSLGCFRAAHGGTIFLDEIGELELSKQAKLLRVLEERTVVPVGSAIPIPVDVRIVAATNRNLDEMIRAGQFRKDLYYRLHVLELKTLALKERREDISVLVSHFLAKLCQENALPAKCVTPAALALLCEYDWPGNVRQLRNVLERAVLYTESNAIEPEAFRSLLESTAAKPTTVRVTTSAPATPAADPDLPRLPTILSANLSETALVVQDLAGSDLPADSPSPMRCQAVRLDSEQPVWLTLNEVESAYVREALRHTLENQTQAAQLLGVTTRVLSRLIKKHGIQLTHSRRGRPAKAK